MMAAGMGTDKPAPWTVVIEIARRAVPAAPIRDALAFVVVPRVGTGLSDWLRVGLLLLDERRRIDAWGIAEARREPNRDDHHKNDRSHCLLQSLNGTER
jgi:hypothetical protein